MAIGLNENRRRPRPSQEYTMTEGEAALNAGTVQTMTEGEARLNEGVVQTIPEANVMGQGFNPTPSVSADQLVAPSTPVTTPVPAVASVPDTSTAQAVSERTNEIIQAETEEAKRLKELRNQYAGVLEEEDLQSMFQSELGDRMVPENLQRLQDVQLQLNKLAEQSGLAQVRIAGAEGQTMAQAGREVTQEQREAAVRSSALAAEASILEGNIETATALASQAVGYAYQDRALRNQNLINQINSLQGVVDGQTSQLLTNQAREYERENLQIAQAISSVNSAVASGFASADDVATMTALSGDPEAQKEYADKIIARAAKSRYQQALAASAANRQAAIDSASNETQGRALGEAVSAADAIKNVDNILNSPLGIKAIAGATGFGRTSISTALDNALYSGVAGAGLGAGAGVAGGPFAPITVPLGAASGFVGGFAAGATSGTFQASSQRVDTAASLGFLVNNATFQELRRLKAQGVTFGSLTEGERIAVGRSADELFSMLEISDDGEVLSVKASEEKFTQTLNDYRAEQERYMQAQQLIAAGLGTADQAFVIGE